jgi:hypothetical protein
MIFIASFLTSDCKVNFVEPNPVSIDHFQVSCYEAGNSLKHIFFQKISSKILLPAETYGNVT